MTRRLVIITEIISPYRIPLFNALSQREDVDLHVVFLSETDPGLRQWQVYKEEIKFSYEVLPSYRKRLGGKYNFLLNSSVGKRLSAAAPDAVLCGGYSYLASWQAISWARRHGVPFFLWSESNLQDLRRRHALVEFLKGRFLRQCTGFVVPGKSAFEFLRSHKVEQKVIFSAVNAVDNDLFSSLAQRARQNGFELRRHLGLPDRYFLFVGRLVREKGIFELLAAYATMDEKARAEIGLVFVGDGPARQELQAQAVTAPPGMVTFVGFAQREPLATYYALAEMLILPTYTDTWGLVVNEAMACGLPVIVSDAAGCAADLVAHGWNGEIVPRRDTAALASAMRNLASQPVLLATMGRNSFNRIAAFSPQNWCDGIARMLARAEARNE